MQSTLRTLLSLGIAGLALTSALPAFAADTNRYYATAAVGASRWDAAVGVGCTGNYDGTTPGLPFGAYACTEGFDDRSSFAIRVGAGWHVSDWLALEAAYANLGYAIVARHAGNTGQLPGGGFTMPTWVGADGKYSLQGVDFSVVGRWPIHRNVDVTGRAGGLLYYQTYVESGSGTHGAAWHWRDSHHGIAPIYGVGLRYVPDAALAFGLEWIRAHRVGKVYGGWRDASGIDEFDVDNVFISVSLRLH